MMAQDDSKEEKRVCGFKSCGTEFHPTRSNQFYCSRKHQVKANNQRAKRIRDLIKQVDQKLKHNRNVLEKLWQEKRYEVTHEQLLSSGFDFSYHTQILTDKEHRSYFYLIYEFAYRLLEKKTYQILHKNELETHNSD